MDSMIHPIKHTEDFFLKFFTKDYPDYVKPKPRKHENVNKYHNSYKYGFDEYGNNGYITNYQYFNNKNVYKNNNDNNTDSNGLKLGHNGYDLNKLQKQLLKQSSRHKILHSLNGYNNNNNNNIVNHNGILNTINNINNNNNNKKAKIIAMMQQQQQQQEIAKRNYEQISPQNQTPSPSPIRTTNGERKEEEEEEKKSGCNRPGCSCNRGQVNPEFIKKIKEIEQKIIDHLHKRGYYEDNPQFWQYIKKAKELAIARAKKERAKLLAQRQLQQQQEIITKQK